MSVEMEPGVSSRDGRQEGGTSIQLGHVMHTA